MHSVSRHINQHFGVLLAPKQTSTYFFKLHCTIFGDNENQICSETIKKITENKTQSKESF